jgi:hypothetical protein
MYAVTVIVHVFIASVLAFIGGVITFALGYEYPLPYLVDGIVFLAYFGVVVLIFDADWG